MRNVAIDLKRGQLRALEIALKKGNYSNYYALINKIKGLKREIHKLAKGNSWNNYLAQ